MGVRSPVTSCRHRAGWRSSSRTSAVRARARRDMRIDMSQRTMTRTLGVLLTALVAMSLAGCSLNEEEVPPFEGPSVRGVAVKLNASPDLLVADGFSTSSIQAKVQGPNGEPISGRQVVFTIADDEGRVADMGILRSTSGNTRGTSV